MKGYVGGRSKEWERTKEGRTVVYCFVATRATEGKAEFDVVYF